MPEIAVFCGETGLTVSPFENADIRIYSNDPEGSWRQIETLRTGIDPAKGLRAVREEFQQLIERLGDTRVIVARELTGVAYTLFDAAGYAIFEMVGRPERFLDFVALRLEEEEAAMSRRLEVPTAPQPVGEEGVYAIDLVKLAEQRPEISSKMALLPFLENTPFVELKVLCSHIPPWFERSFAGTGLGFDSERTEDGLHRVRVFHTPCGGRG